MCTHFLELRVGMTDGFRKATPHDRSSFMYSSCIFRLIQGGSAQKAAAELFGVGPAGQGKTCFKKDLAVTPYLAFLLWTLHYWTQPVTSLAS